MHIVLQIKKVTVKASGKVKFFSDISVPSSHISSLSNLTKESEKKKWKEVKYLSLLIVKHAASICNFQSPILKVVCTVVY